MHKYHKKYDNMNYIRKNYTLKSIHNDANKCINDKSSKRQIRITMNKFTSMNINENHGSVIGLFAT